MSIGRGARGEGKEEVRRDLCQTRVNIYAPSIPRAKKNIHF